jgi:repressor LexA
MKQLTRRQEEILRFVVSFQERMGRTPTGPEIATEFRFSDHSSAYQHLRQIAQKGFIELTQPAVRGPICIRLLDRAALLMKHSWPLLGSIPAGPLAETGGDVRRHLNTLEDLVPGLRPGDFFLVVDGDSMIDAGLEPGQYVAVRPGVEPVDGDICAVWIDGEGGTLKRVFDEGSHVRLVPANKRYRATRYPAEHVRIQGVLVAALSVQAFRR